MFFPNHNQFQRRHWDKIAKNIPILEWKQIPYPAIKEMEEFFDFMALKEKSHILEIGCGRGRYTLPLLKRGHRILGTDLSKKSLYVLKTCAKKENLAARLQVEQNSFENESRCRKYFGKFDLALMVAVIHHFDPQKREKIFTNIVRCLKKGGWAVALEPNPLNIFYYFLYFWRFLINEQNVNRWATEKGMLFTSSLNLKYLFKRAGLKDIQTRGYAFLPSSFGKRFPPVLTFNDFLVKLPLIKELAAFIWIKGKKE